MTAPRKPPRGAAKPTRAASEAAQPVLRDPYGQVIEFNGKHIARQDYAGERVGPVPQDEPEKIAGDVKIAAANQLGAQIGLPAAVVLLIIELLVQQL
jgi:hypothetical protein